MTFDSVELSSAPPRNKVVFLLREEKLVLAVCNAIDPEKPGDLKGSTQHWLAVYPPEFEIPRFVVAGY